MRQGGREHANNMGRIVVAIQPVSGDGGKIQRLAGP